AEPLNGPLREALLAEDRLVGARLAHLPSPLGERALGRLVLVYGVGHGRKVRRGVGRAAARGLATGPAQYANSTWRPAPSPRRFERSSRSWSQFVRRYSSVSSGKRVSRSIWLRLVPAEIT